MKKILVDHTKCTGCRQCETACSVSHSDGEINPTKSRIRIYIDEKEGAFYPVIAGAVTKSPCDFKPDIILDGNNYSTCKMCRTSCPNRPWFIDPLTERPFQCDACGYPPNPQCVEVCAHGALQLIDDERYAKAAEDPSWPF